jgi:hypothetical protein
VFSTRYWQQPLPAASHVPAPGERPQRGRQGGGGILRLGADGDVVGCRRVAVSCCKRLQQQQLEYK